MAKLADGALSTILSGHPTAQLDLWLEQGLRADLADGTKSLVTSIGARL